MDKDLLYRLLIYISAFGVSDNVLNYFKVSTQKRIILYILLFIFTCVFLRTSSHSIDQGLPEKNV